MVAASAPKADEKAEDITAPEGQNQSNLPAAERPPGDLRRRVGTSKRKGPFVKYVGAAALRRIDATAWRSLGIKLTEGEESTEHNWTVGNDKMIEASKFSDAQLDYLLIDDLQQGSGAHAFLLVDYDKDGQLVQAVYE